jgi:hypothetical protein
LEGREEKMIWARSTLEAHGFEVSSSIVAGDRQKVLHEAIETHVADLLVTGAYGHAKDRQMVVGSTIAGCGERHLSLVWCSGNSASTASNLTSAAKLAKNQ